MFMQKLFPIYFLLTLVVCGIFCCVFPYPLLQSQANINDKDIYDINNFYEEEEEIAEPQPTISVSNLNWFDTVNATFPTYTKTRVIDIKSGKTYYVYRNGGHNHADVEPIDRKNTEIFHSIYNYEWSWTRRPVWVEITENNFVAGSINGYPHGQSYIENTGMNGHTCIHFLLSKTHGTKRVDEAHQEAVEYAYAHRDEISKYL